MDKAANFKQQVSVLERVVGQAQFKLEAICKDASSEMEELRRSIEEIQRLLFHRIEFVDTSKGGSYGSNMGWESKATSKYLEGLGSNVT
jgi:hypothetical protein